MQAVLLALALEGVQLEQVDADYPIERVGTTWYDRPSYSWAQPKKSLWWPHCAWVAEPMYSRTLWLKTDSHARPWQPSKHSHWSRMPLATFA